MTRNFLIESRTLIPLVETGPMSNTLLCAHFMTNCEILIVSVLSAAIRQVFSMLRSDTQTSVVRAAKMNKITEIPMVTYAKCVNQHLEFEQAHCSRGPVFG